MTMARKSEAAANIGLDVEPPEGTCDDSNCPFHGELPVRGSVLTGTVVSTKMQGTVAVEREHLKYVQKYERHEKRTSRYLAHSPPCMQLKTGDKVSMMECRPLSKRVSYVVIEKKR
jgi:small subunit ribosomal protein S17